MTVPQGVRSFPNLIEMFLWRVKESATKPALGAKRSGSFRYLDWREFACQVRLTALALYQQGVRKGDRVGILSENRPEWAFADLGTLSLGAVSVPIYPTCSEKECHYVIEHSGIQVLFVSTREQFEKVRRLVDSGQVRTVIGFDLKEKPAGHILTYEDCLEAGRLANLNNPNLYENEVRKVGREDLATLIYTSGTTGPPKGVMLTHGNFLSNCEAASEVLPVGREEKSLSFLPLSHVFERMAGYYFMMFNGVSISYAESMQTVPEDLLLVRPTVAAAVPRLYEKMYARIQQTVESSPAVTQQLFRWAVRTGEQASRLRAAGRSVPLLLKLRFLIAQVLVFGKLKRGLGGRIRFFISGGAPLAKELAEFFYSAGVLILEGYGLTETSPVISVNRPGHFKFGTVGPLLPNVEVRIAPDGEILTQGPHVMKGYFKNEEATRQAIQAGWFYTGDLGEIDPDGFLKVTGRKKDLIITAGGKNISPQNIENEILGDVFFSQVVVLGDRRPYLVALIVPNRQELERLAAFHGIEAASWEDLLKKPTVKDWVGQRLGEKMKDFASYEQIKYFHLLPKELSQEAGEVTPTLKIKRRVVMERYSSLIEELYRQGQAYAPTHGH